MKIDGYIRLHKKFRCGLNRLHIELTSRVYEEYDSVASMSVSETGIMLFLLHLQCRNPSSPIPDPKSQYRWRCLYVTLRGEPYQWEPGDDSDSLI